MSPNIGKSKSDLSNHTLNLYTVIHRICVFVRWNLSFLNPFIINGKSIHISYDNKGHWTLRQTTAFFRKKTKEDIKIVSLRHCQIGREHNKATQYDPHLKIVEHTMKKLWWRKGYLSVLSRRRHRWLWMLLLLLCIVALAFVLCIAQTVSTSLNIYPSCCPNNNPRLQHICEAYCTVVWIINELIHA